MCAGVLAIVVVLIFCIFLTLFLYMNIPPMYICRSVLFLSMRLPLLSSPPMYTGVAGLAAVGTARGLGARVRAFDTRSAVREEVTR
jgi:hypothetical protein